GQTTDALVLLEEVPDVFAFRRAAGAFRRLGGTLGLAWRQDAARGLYATAEANVLHFLDPDASPLHTRAADALPAVWGQGRFGVRALDLFDGALDLDLAARGHAWTAFGSRRFVSAPALFALPGSAGDVPARGTLDLVAEARLQERASLFLVYENVLATRLYDGAYLVPIHPLPAHRLRFGVFWALFN